MFDRESTAEQIARSSDLRGRNAVLTGASSGIGAETARALALAGADLILGVRDVAAGEVVAREIATAANSTIRVLPLDLSDLHAVAAFADQVTGPVDLLIANAGVSKTPQTHLPNGLELRFATNHLGHFLLALRLRRQMAERGARLLVLSSAAHKGLPVHLDDLQWRKRPHSLAAYGESKSANILFAQEATRRWSTHGIYANAILPGSALTGLQRHHGDEMKRRIGFILPDGTVNPAVKSIAQAAATTLWAASSPELEQRGGLVLEDCGEALPVGPLTHPWSGYDARVADRETARLLWEHSLGLLSELCGGAIIPGTQPSLTRRKMGVSNAATSGISAFHFLRHSSPCDMATANATGTMPARASNPMPASAELPVHMTSSTSSTRRPARRRTRRGSSHMVRPSPGEVTDRVATDSASSYQSLRVVPGATQFG